MKYYVLIFCTFLYASCNLKQANSNNQNISSNRIDSLELVDNIYLYKEMNTRERSIEIPLEYIKHTLHLPIPDFEVKNFSLDEFIENDTGYELRYSWGGGNYFHSGTFYLANDGTNLFVCEQNRVLYVHLDDIITEKRIIFDPPMDINSFDLKEYL